MISRLALPFLCLLLLAACTQQSERPGIVPVTGQPLRIMSWNLEFLAEQDGAGCRPRTQQDYARLRQIADSLDADVIAFQEVESEAAAARIFDPARYAIVIEERPGTRRGQCRGRAGQYLTRQAVGMAIRRTIAFDRGPDLTRLQLGDPDLRSAVDVTIRPEGARPLRLLGVHLKSGCFSGRQATACPVLLDQIPIIEAWIDDAARGPYRFAVLGDWNRRLDLAGDLFWTEIDDGDPPNADLVLANAGTPPRCDPRYDQFIDHIVLDRRAGDDMIAFRETTFVEGERPSDHCPIEVTLRR